MTYAQWFESHSDKHYLLNQKLLNANLSQAEIVKYYRFENMLIHEPDFCELYKTKSKCHDMEELNCYLCACPNFRFTMKPKLQEKKILHSFCSIDSQDGAVFEHENNIHQDCSGCLVPHHESYIVKNFDNSWKKIMRSCEEK